MSRVVKNREFSKQRGVCIIEVTGNEMCIGNRIGRVKVRINITRVFRNCRNCPSRAATRAISVISENTSDINP